MGTRSTTSGPAPIKGFGPCGVVLLLVFLALVVMLAAGVDLRFKIQWVVSRLFGDVFMYNFTIYGIVAQGLMAYIPTLFPWTGIPLLVALHLAPGRHRLLLGTIIMLWMFAAAGVWLKFAEAISKSGVPLPAWRGVDVGTTAAVLMDLLTLALLWVVTRDRLIVLAGVVGLAIAWPIASIPSTINLWNFVSVGVLHAATAPVIIRWGIRARRAALRPPYVCPACGYDRRGVEDHPCPECGFIESVAASR